VRTPILSPWLSSSRISYDAMDPDFEKYLRGGQLLDDYHEASFFR
jgi:hypothetical protein